MAIAPLFLLLPRRWSLGGCVFLAAALAATVAGFHSPRRGDQLLAPDKPDTVWTAQTDWQELSTRFDAHLGHRGLPSVRARHHKKEFDVYYSMDQDGWRTMPRPSGPGPHREILFLGCSCTFGTGVNDDQTYPALLAGEAWKGYRVRNLALSGYGSTHCLLVLRDALNSGAVPAAVFYGFIVDHLRRNSLRRSWHRQVHSRYVPHFDETGDYLGTVGIDQVQMPDSPETDAVERRTTRAVIRKMRDLCRDRGVPFFVLLLQERNDSFHDELLEDLSENLLDLRVAAAEVYGLDGHPTPLGHRQIARALAANPLIAAKTGISDLFQPAAVAPAPDAAAIRLKLSSPAENPWAEIHPLEQTDGVRLDALASPSGNEFAVALVRNSIAIRRDRYYQVEVRARADRPRAARILVAGLLPPEELCGPLQPIWLTPEWRDFSFAWSAQRDEPYAVVSLLAGGNDIPLEVARMDARELSAEEWASFHVQTNEQDLRNYARITAAGDGARQGFRLEQISSPSGINWQVRAERRGLTLEAGRRYRVTGRARADAPRPVDIVPLRDEPPYPAAGLSRRIDLTDQWLALDFTFAATVTGPAVLSIQAGESEVPLEMEDVQLEEVEGTP